jgi:NAD(P)-dependent dehydrogenase (short-subunit alcohol dehydrogenase family)
MVLSGMPEPGTPVDRRHEEGRLMTLRKPGVILVTGGGSGIGAAMVRHFTAAGHQVAIADIDVAGGESLADATGGLFIRTDVSDFAANKAAVAQTVERFGGLDAVCLNAGIGGGGPLVGEEFDPDRYHLVIHVNLDGVVYGLNAALPALHPEHQRREDGPDGRDDRSDDHEPELHLDRANPVQWPGSEMRRGHQPWPPSALA